MRHRGLIGGFSVYSLEGPWLGGSPVSVFRVCMARRSAALRTRARRTNLLRVTAHTALTLIDIATCKTEGREWDDAWRWLGGGVLKKQGHNLHQTCNRYNNNGCND